MPLIIDQPFRVVIPPECDSEDLRKLLTYRDKSVYFELSKIRKAARFNPESEYWHERIIELEAKKKKCLLKSENGVLYTYAGLADTVSEHLHMPIENKITYPKPDSIPWLKEPKHKMRPFQKEAFIKLLEAKHGAVSIGTGLGKSLIILHLVKELGLPAVIMAPSKSIANQLYDLFVESFGKKYVGMFGSGKKQSKKKFVIAIAASLARLQVGDKHYDNFATRPVFITDESHLTPAKTLADICLGPLRQAPYRFFFSATQMRIDGADLLLYGIIGRIVYNMTVSEGVEQGYLAKPVFTMLRVTSDSTFSSSDANAMDRQHLLLNQKVLRNAANIANRAFLDMGYQTLILIDEFEQAAHLDRYLQVPREFAHGGLKSVNEKDKKKGVRDPKGFLPERFWKSDVHDQVTRFNAKQFPVLIGTSAIGLGTDIQPVQVLVFIQKGVSEVKFKQGVGRGTRKVFGKEACRIFDWDVENKDIVHRHALKRADIYESIIGDVRWIDIGE